MKALLRSAIGSLFAEQIAKMRAEIVNDLSPQIEGLVALHEKSETRLKSLEQTLSRLIVNTGQLKNGLEDLRRSTDAAKTMPDALRALSLSAPGRGNVSLPDNRLLTRLSLPQYFERNEPLYFTDSRDKLIVPKLAMTGHYEWESTHFVCRHLKPGQHVIDVGANFGYYSVIFAVLVGWKGKVLAFEPHPGMHQLLVENAVINWVEKWLETRQMACSDRAATIPLYASVARAANTGPSIPDIPEGLGPDFDFTPIEVTSTRIDDHLAHFDGRVDFIKMDIEGGEQAAVRGASGTFRANPHAVLMMEWSVDQLQKAGTDLDQFRRELQSLGRRAFTPVSDGDLSPITWDELMNIPYANIVLLPAQ